jgi:hypothetical protein
MTAFTPHQRAYLAHWLTLTGKAEDSLTQTIAGARVDMNPHQVEAALFALASPLSGGVMLADEVGLGKTIEAALVLAQKWAERRRQLLLIVPATLRKQWSMELEDKFSLPSVILESANFNAARKAGAGNPFDLESASGKPGVVICSYEFAARKQDEVARIAWDFVVLDEAHKLRNIYKGSSAKTASKINEALQNRPKALLSATPLQNNLQELYGLVSVIDPHFFGSLDAFKARYARQPVDEAELFSLRQRLRKICFRTLRSDVQKEGGLNFTRRYSLTEDFTPSEAEKELYQQVSEYLQDNDILAIKPGARHLVTLVIRKILASSSYAIAGTLNTLVERLEGKLPLKDAMQDYEALDDLLDGNAVEDEELIDTEALQAEIERLKDFKQLAGKIEQDAKADALLRVFGRAFEMTERLGGQRKAVIFTESLRTQERLFQILRDNGYAGQIVLLNGNNADAVSKEIYRDWLDKHQGTGRVSGSKSADMKAALVEKFRDQAALLICSEAGAEGINLQFCSLLINYDLPWNPQRVEQRIGRVHRYGQKHDVVVVNFVNRGNRADERVFELLNEKFKLFEGVFGASDEILGAIESGVDIERRIHEIYQNCRNDAQIEEEFNKLQAAMKEQIEARNQDTRRSLLDHFDADVIKNLNLRRQKAVEQLNEYQQRLLLLARMSLPGAEFNEHHFCYQGMCYDPRWEDADNAERRFFRPHEGLGWELIEQAKDSVFTDTAALHFVYSPHVDGQFTDLRALIGQTGELRVDKLTLSTPAQTVEHLLLAACTQDGEILATETIDRLLCQPARENPEAASLTQTARLQTHLDDLQADALKQAERDNERYYEEESEKLERWAEDRRLALDLRIKQLDKDIKEMRKASRQLGSLQEKIEAKRELKKLEQARDTTMLDYHEEKKRIEEEEDRLLADIEGRLQLAIRRACLFSAAWSLGDGG